MSRMIHQIMWERYTETDRQLTASRHNLEIRRLLNALLHRLNTPVSNLRIAVSFMASRRESGAGVPDGLSDALDTSRSSILEIIRRLERYQTLVSDLEDEAARPTPLVAHLGQLPDLLEPEQESRIRITGDTGVVVETKPDFFLRTLSSLVSQLIRLQMVDDGSQLMLTVAASDENSLLRISGLSSDTGTGVLTDTAETERLEEVPERIALRQTVASFSEALGIEATVVSGDQSSAIELRFPR